MSLKNIKLILIYILFITIDNVYSKNCERIFVQCLTKYNEFSIDAMNECKSKYLVCLDQENQENRKNNILECQGRCFSINQDCKYDGKSERFRMSIDDCIQYNYIECNKDCQTIE